MSSSPQAAVVITSNLGGEMALRLMRTSARLLRGEGSDEEEDPFTVEAIASSMPSMCSGYPAYHFDLKGFHETLAGAPGAFFTSLALTETWLAGEIDAVLLGAARLIKSPADTDTQAPDTEAQTEGAAVFLMEPVLRARERGHRIVGVVTAMVASVAAGDFEAACRVAGVAPGSIDLRETCQLRAGFDPASGSAQRAIGSLGEATGIEAFARVLCSDAKRASIEVFDGEQLTLTVFVEREASFDPPSATFALAVETRFERKPAGMVEEAAAAEVNAPRDVTALLRFVESTEQGMRQYFAAQREVIARCGGRPTAVVGPATACVDAFERVPVLAHFVEDTKGRRARLVVDETHPYFFDHPLDHVPGILLLEGILQLIDGPRLRTSGGEAYVRNLRLRFRRFCEKEGSIDIDIKGADRFSGSVRQGGLVCATFEGEVCPDSAELDRPSAADESAGPREAPELLHKHHAENVLVSPLECRDGVYNSAVYAPAPGHMLAAGSPRHYSPLFILEAARQVARLGANVAMGVQRGQFMNHLSIDVALAAPLRRHVPLHMRLEPGKINRIDAMLLAEVRTVLVSGRDVLGVVTIKSQVVDEETYRVQRKGKA